MATTSRDAKLTLNVETLGTEAVSKLKSSLLELSKQGGEGAAEFAELADQIGRLGEQSTALQAVKGLAASTDELTQRQVEAAQKVQSLAQNLDVLRAATDAARLAETEAKQAYNEGDLAKTKAVNALRELKAGYDNAGKQTEEYRAKLRELVAAQSQSEVELKQLAVAQREATAGVKESADAQKLLESAYKTANAQLSAAESVLQKHNGALHEASTAAQSLGVEIGDLAASEAKLQTTFANATSVAAQQHKALEDLAAAEAELSAQAAIAAQRMADRNKFAAAAFKADQEVAEAARLAAAALEQQAAAARLAEQALREQAAAAQLAEEVAREQRESDRLVAIQMNSMIELRKRAQDALEAENASQREAAQLTQRLATAQQEAADKAAANANRINEAFKTISSRPIEQVRLEIANVNAAMATLASSGKMTGGQLAVAMQQGEAKVKSLEREMRALNGTMTAGDKAANLLKNSMGQIAAGNIAADAVGYLVNKVKELGREFIATTVETEQFRRGLMAVYKDSAVAGAQFEYLRKTAQASGLSIGELAPSFLAFSAATKSANIPLNVTNDLFATITRVSSSLGLSTDQAKGALEALGQMASKGCHAPGTLIRMADGGQKFVELITPGEKLMGPDGAPRTVILLATGVEPMYRVTPARGVPFVVNLHHKLRLVRGSVVETVELKDYLSEPTGFLQHHSFGPVSFSIECIGDGPYHGFLISGDHLYLDAQGFEHHNTVSLEELRQQLGDRMPGAMSAAARGLGLTEAELIKLVESGSLAARDFFPAFSAGLKSLQGDTEGLLPIWNRLKNAFTTTAQAAGDSGGLQVMTLLLRTLAAACAAVIIPLSLIGDTIFTVVRSLAIFTAAVATMSNPIAALKENWSDLAKRQSQIAKSFGDVIFGAEAVKDELVNLAAATAAAAQAAATAGAAWDTMTASQQVGAIAAVIAADSQKDLSAKLVQTSAAISQAMSSQEKHTEALAKSAKATKENGEAMKETAQLRGDEGKALEVSAIAAWDNANALTALAASHAEETKLLEMKLAKLIETRKAQGDSNELIAKQTLELEKQIKVSRAAAEQALASASASRIEATAKTVAAEAYADNSAQLGLYRDALQKANEMLALTIELERVGAVGKAEVEVATRKVAIAQALYRDALKDTASNLQLEIKTRIASLEIAKQSVSSEVALLNAKAEQARNSGLLVTALDLERAAKRKQLEVDKLLLDIKEIQLALLREELKAQIELLKINEPSNLLKLKELELRTRLTEIQEKEIASGRELLKIKSDELKRSEMLSTNIGNEVNARANATTATDRHSTALDELMMRYTQSADLSERQIALLEREAAAAEKAAEAYRKKWNVDKDGFTLDSNGQRQSMSMPTASYILDTGKGAGLSDEQIAQLLNEYFANGQASGTPQGGVLGVSKDWFSIVNEAITELRIRAVKDSANKPQEKSEKSSTTSAATSESNASTKPKTPSSGAKTLVVEVGTTRTSFNLSSEEDRNRAVSVIRHIETLKGTAS